MVDYHSTGTVFLASSLNFSLSTDYNRDGHTVVWIACMVVSGTDKCLGW